MIDGVIIKNLVKHSDSRGWLCEIFRSDEMLVHPAMAYLSETAPGVARGPHEHIRQTDCFCFFGSFVIHLWDNRGNATLVAYDRLPIDSPTLVIVPPGVVHAYRNVGAVPALVVNFPDRLYCGEGRAEPVDEIRYEGDPSSPFLVP